MVHDEKISMMILDEIVFDVKLSIAHHKQLSVIEKCPVSHPMVLIAYEYGSVLMNNSHNLLYTDCKINPSNKALQNCASQEHFHVYKWIFVISLITSYCTLWEQIHRIIYSDSWNSRDDLQFKCTYCAPRQNIE